jgi:hypothetical protein
VKDDEFHPDARHAAKFADQNARQFALESFQRRLKRLVDKPTALTPGEASMFMQLKAEIHSIKDAIKLAEAEGKFVDLGEYRADGSLRTSWERWPNGAPT